MDKYVNELPVVALVGTPNSGKTTIFNQLTHSNYKTANWAGVTVEKVEGVFSLNREEKTAGKIIDLPGCSSILSSDGNSPDELVVKQYLETKQADLAISVLDSTNLEQGLYQCIQLSIMQIPYIVVCNMSDIAHVRGINIRVDELSKILNVPVISTSAVNKSSLRLLKEAIEQALFAVSRDKLKPNPIDLGDLQDVIFDDKAQLKTPSLKEIIKINDFIYHLSAEYANKSLVKAKTETTVLQDKIDRIVLHKYLGLPIFLVMMYLVFFVALTIGNGILVPGLGQLANIPFVDVPAWLLHEVHAPDVIITIVVDGIGTALAALFGFIPVVGLVYLLMSILEASGYMVRASIVVDRFLNMIGLSGSMFLPLVVGFGCNIATIAGARTLPTHAERQATILMSPFMSCSARLPVYALFCAAFIPQYSAIVVFSLYIVGILLAIFTGVVVKRTILQAKKSPLIVRMPNYLRPQWNMILRITGNNIKAFLQRLGGMFLILVASVGILGAVSMKGDVNVDMKDSILADISKKATVLLYPIGFTDKDWQATVGLITGAVAKEVVVGTMTSIYSQSDGQGDDSANSDSANSDSANADNSSTNPDSNNVEPTSQENNVNISVFALYIVVIALAVFVLMFIKKKISGSQAMARRGMKRFKRRLKGVIILLVLVAGVLIAFNVKDDATVRESQNTMGLLTTIKHELVETKGIFIDGLQATFDYSITADNDDIKIIKNNAVRFEDTSLTLGFLLFILAYFPCFATISMAKKEGGMKIALFSGLWSFTLAYVVSGTFFCLTHLSSISTTRLITQLVILWGILILEIIIMKLLGSRSNKANLKIT